MNQLCDGERQCPLADDEDRCHVICPEQCLCTGLSVECANKIFSEFPESVDTFAKLINLNHNKITTLSNASLYFPFIAKLYLSDNKIANLEPQLFITMRNLLVLDLSYNRLHVLVRNTFMGLSSLILLNLTGNYRLLSIEENTFRDLVLLPLLNISGTQLTYINDETFQGLSGLKTLDVSYNTIQFISDNAFVGLVSLSYLELKGNDIKRISRATFEPLINLSTLESDAFKLCCLASQVNRENCVPPQDPISSCQDLMQNNILRTFIWILGTMAFLGNVFVIGWRMKYPTSGVPDIIISNLAISDFIMGLYLLIIAGVDFYYQGVFIEFSDMWRESWLCQIAGFLATFSSEASVMFLGFLTVDRFINIIMPFSNKKFVKSTAKSISLFIWLLCFLVSVAPFIPMDYFGEDYYGRSGVCMALPITNERPQGRSMCKLQISIVCI